MTQRSLTPVQSAAALAAWAIEDPARSPWPLPPAVTIPIPPHQRALHRCDESCTCPADGQPMWYAPSTGQHACQDPGCTCAHPGGGGD